MQRIMNNIGELCSLIDFQIPTMSLADKCKALGISEVICSSDIESSDVFFNSLEFQYANYLSSISQLTLLTPISQPLVTLLCLRGPTSGGLMLIIIALKPLAQDWLLDHWIQYQMISTLLKLQWVILPGGTHYMSSAISGLLGS